LPFGLEEPSDPSSTVIGEFMEKILFVTSMRDMPDMTRQEIPIGSRQVSPLFSFQGQNGGSKRKIRAKICKLSLQTNDFPRSDPDVEDDQNLYNLKIKPIYLLYL
jgi:hypothetical protein